MQLCGLCSVAVCNSGFNNDDRLGNRPGVIMGIEPVFPHEHIPLMHDGKTRMHFIFRGVIEFKSSMI